MYSMDVITNGYAATNINRNIFIVFEKYLFVYK